tara:strand:+ start:1386 stop:2090 length:705 start_codon:yes stop_codon:yes gene_type:complete
MNDKINFETYLYLGKSKLALCIFEIDKKKRIYEKEIFLKNDYNNLKFDELKKFLDENIFKVEKNFNCFIKSVNIVLEVIDFFSVNISIKNDNHANGISKESLIYSLNDAKNQCKKTLEGKKIIHMIIDNYHINNKNFSSFPENTICESFAVDIRFICLPHDVISKIESLLKNYQISLGEIASFSYIQSYFKEANKDLFEKVKDIFGGCNENEIKFHNKIVQNQGFFEKFFNFFS